MIEEKNSFLPQETGPASGAIVVDPNGKEYRLTRYLARGMHGHIYVVEPVSSDFGETRPKVVKFGILPLKETDERYQRELKLVQAIRQYSNNCFVPDIVLGKWRDERWATIPVLIMDRMGSDQEDWSLSAQMRNLRSAGHIQQAELLALKAGVQYAKLLKILHENLKTASPDRKPGDFYWDPSKEALYVLDWNVVSDLPEDSNTRAAKIQADIRQFGRYWFEMLVSFPPDRVEDLSIDEPRPGSTWAQLTRGMRRLLVRTISAGLEQEGFQDDQVVLRHWTGYLEIIKEQQPRSLLDRAQQAKQQADKNFLDRSLWIESWEIIADVYDLLKRISPSHVSEIERWINDREAILEKQLETKLQEGKDTLKNGDYSTAAQGFEAVAQDHRFNPSKRLRALRWYYVAKTLSENVTKDYQAGDRLVQPLEELLSCCEESKWNPAFSKLAQIAAQERRYLEIIGAEIKYRCALQQFDDLNSSLKDRLKAYQQAHDELEKIRTQQDPLAEIYVDLLKLDFAQATAVADMLRERQREEEIRDQEREEIQATLKRVSEQFDNMLKQPSPVWPDDLTPELEKWDPRLYTPPYLRKLISLNRIMGREGLTLRALDAAEEAYRALQTSGVHTQGVDSLGQKLGLAVYKLAFQRIRELAEKPRWPSKVGLGIHLAERLVGLSFLKDEQRNALNEVSRTLDTYKNCWDALHQTLPTLETVWDPKRLTDLTIDEALREAEEKGVELFDPVPGDVDPNKVSVQRLIATRATAKGLRLAEALYSLESQIRELDDTVKKLKESLEPLGVRTALEVGTTKPPGRLTPEPELEPPPSEAGSEPPPRAEPVLAPPQISRLWKKFLPSGVPKRPVLVGLASLSMIALLLFLLVSGFPLRQMWEQLINGSSEPVTIDIESWSTSTGQAVLFLNVHIKDGKGNSLPDQKVTIEAKGRGKLVPVDRHQLVSAEGERYLVMRTDAGGVRIRYERPGVGDLILVRSSNITKTFEVPSTAAAVATSTPTPLPTTPTPVPPPKLDLAIEATVDGQIQERVQPGQKLIYTVKATNIGEHSAEGMTLRCSSLAALAQPSDLGGLVVSKGFLTQQGISIPSGQSRIWRLVYTVASSIDPASLAGTPFVLACTLIFGDRGIINKESAPIQLELPKLIEVQPPNAEIGIGEQLDLAVTVKDATGMPSPGQQIAVSFEPPGIITMSNTPSPTGEDGKTSMSITAQQMGTAQLVIGIAGAQGSGTASITAWPLLEVSESVNIRAEPNGNARILDILREGRFRIIGRNADTSWLQIHLRDGRTGWVSQRARGVRVLHEAEIEKLPVRGETAQPTPISQVQTESTPESVNPAPTTESLVPFYTVGVADERGIFLYLPAGSKSKNAVSNVELGMLQETPPKGYKLVQISFWIREALVIEQGVVLRLMPVTNTNEWACWQIPQSEPSTETSNCGQLSVRTEPIGLVSSGQITNGWRLVTVRAWIKAENFTPTN